MNRAEIFFDAITNIREDLIEEAQNVRFRRRAVPWGKYMGWAACLALVVCVGWFSLTLFGGGMGGGSNGADSGSSGSSGSAAPSGDTAPPLQGVEPAVPGDTPETAPGGISGGQVQETFLASVVEVHERYILVEPLEGEAVRDSADRIILYNGDVMDLPALEAGDVLRITFNGEILESYPAQLGEVYSVGLAE